MNEGAWSRFLEYAARARTKPTFDVEERRWKLEAAKELQGVLSAARRGEQWLPRALAVLNRPRPPFVTATRQRRWLRAWAEADPAGLARAVAGFEDGALDPVERLARFDEAAARFDPSPRTRVSSVVTIGSLLNFAHAPERSPIVRPSAHAALAQMLGVEVRDAASAVEAYRNGIEIVSTVEGRLRRFGVPVRDVIDVQSLVSIGVEEAAMWREDPPADWLQRARRPRPPGGAYLAACALYRDEAPFLREWLEFHRLAGVERFFLYDNGSADEHLDVLSPYIAAGIAVRHEWPASPPVQREVFDDCLRRHRTDARWIAFVDVDEFLFSPTRRPLGEVLRAYEEWPGVGVNWAMFSYAGHDTTPAGLVTESYPFRDTAETGLIKSIVDPLRTADCKSAHWFTPEYGLPGDERGWPIAGAQTKSTSFEHLRINHYVSRSAAEAREKISRGAGWKHLRRWRQRDLDGRLELVRDDVIAPWVPRLKSALREKAPA